MWTRGHLDFLFPFSEGMRYATAVFKEIDFESLRDRGDFQALMRPKG